MIPKYIADRQMNENVGDDCRLIEILRATNMVCVHENSFRDS